MIKIDHLNLKSLLVMCMLLSLCMAYAGANPYNILTPDDPVIGQPNNNDWPGNEAPQHAIDGDVETKFLHFLSGDPKPVPGIIVTPQFGTGTPQATVVQEIALYTANDEPGRDPVAYELYGSNDTTSNDNSVWNLIASGSIVDFAGTTEWPRQTRNSTPITFANSTEYLKYKLMFTELRDPSAVFQIAEIELIGLPGQNTFYIDQHPANLLIGDGEQAMFEVAAVSNNSVEYQWYFNDSPITGANNSVLSFTAGLADEGAYHCVVTDTVSSDQRTSAVASLAIARMRAHWTLDEADFVGGYYLDASGANPVAYDALVNGTPNFVTGLVGDAVDMQTGIGAANAGTWNPMEHSNQMTVSFWVNWAGVNGGWQKFVAKRTDWDDAGMHWHIAAEENTPNLRIQSVHSHVQVDNALIDDGQWQHVIVTYADGSAKIYIDGELRVEGAFTLGAGTDSALMIGCQDPLWYAPANGAMDNVKIFNYALSGLEIAEIAYTEGGKTPCMKLPAIDMDGSCVVGLVEFAEIAKWWLYNGLY